MKNFYLITLIGIIVLTLGGYAYTIYHDKQVLSNDDPLPKTTQTVTPTTTPSLSAEEDEALLRLAVLKKSGIPNDKFEFSIGANSGYLAKGTVRNTDDMGGAMWVAGKIQGNWKVSYIGQGVPLCSEVSEFTYPATWLSHCVDAKGNTRAR